jgi:nitrogen fixation protein FixH
MTSLANRLPPASSGRIWAWVPAMILVGLLGTQLTVLHFVLDDPSFALEPDYYQKAMAWDARRDAERESLALGWHSEFSATPARGASGMLLRAQLRGPDGSPISGATLRIVAFANARASHVQQSELRESSPGLYEAELQSARPGLWEFRLEARRGKDTFQQVLRRGLAMPGAAP